MARVGPEGILVAETRLISADRDFASVDGGLGGLLTRKLPFKVFQVDDPAKRTPRER